MVCERDPTSPNDPAEGRIELVRDGEWLTADGTTLGADDGVAIAAMMALVEDESLPHGPLELLMTVAEEVGLEGANALDRALVTGSILINLDSEEDGRLTVGCAGQHRHLDPARRAARARPTTDAVDARRDGQRRARAATPASGIALGHVERDQGARARSARGARDGAFRLVSLAGGKSRNAIPRDAGARRARSRAEPRAALPRRGRRPPPRRSATRTPRPTPASRSTVDASRGGRPTRGRRRRRRALLDAVALVPTGPLAMSPGLRRPRRDEHVARRGDHRGRPADAAQPLALVQRLGAARGDRRRSTPPRGSAGGTLEVKHNYGGWRPNLDSPALAAAPRGRTSALFGEPPIVTAVHAGLETAVIGTKVAGPRHALVRAADRVPALPRRAREHPDRRAVLEAAGRRASTSCPRPGR